MIRLCIEIQIEIQIEIHKLCADSFLCYYGMERIPLKSLSHSVIEWHRPINK